MKWLLAASMLFLCQAAPAQSPAFLLLKKKGHTKQVIFSGQDITLETNTGAIIKANISSIKNDSVYLREYIIQTVISHYGFYYLDTAGSFYYQYHYKDIRALHLNKNKKFNFTASGGNLMSGSVLLTAGSLVTLITNKKQFSLPLLITSAALGGLGYLVYKASVKPAVIGRKYQLVYMQTR